MGSSTARTDRRTLFSASSAGTVGIATRCPEGTSWVVLIRRSSLGRRGSGSKRSFLRGSVAGLERWEFDFPPEEANFDILEEVGIEIPSTVPGKTRDTRPPMSLVDEHKSTAGQSESETPSAAIRQRACPVE